MRSSFMGLSDAGEWTARSRTSEVTKCGALFKSSSRALPNGGGPLTCSRRARHHHPRWFPSGIKREHGEAPPFEVGADAVAAPATVSGEPRANYATGQPGRRRNARTREPGDLPSAVVTHEHVGRGAPMGTRCRLFLSRHLDFGSWWRVTLPRGQSCAFPVQIFGAPPSACLIVR